MNPQIVLDHEGDKELANVDTEWGYIIAPSAGASAYVRPGFVIGGARAFDWNLETGLKFVWR